MNNDTEMRSKLFVFGTYEAVAEACMKVWRSTGVSSEVVRGLYVFEAEFGGIAGTPGGFCMSLSQSYPSIMTGVSVVKRTDSDAGQEHCFWGAAGFINGDEVLSGITGSHPDSLPEDIAAQVADVNGKGALPCSSIPRLHEYGAERLQQAAIDHFNAVAAIATETASADTNRHGFPRWSLLTHSVNSLGLGGFEQCLSPLASDDPMATESHLIEQVASDMEHKTASWPDALFFGSRTPSCDEDDRLRIPYRSNDVSIWSDRRVGVLQYLGNARENDHLANALVRSLSHPNVVFQDGAHPMPWLLAHGAPDEDSSAGLKRILDAVGTHHLQFPKNVIAQAFRAAASIGYSQDSLQMLLRMGQSPGFIASKSLLTSTRPQAEQVDVAGRLIDGFRCIYGGLKDFPVELQSAFEDGTDCVAQAFEAKRTEELMSSAISNWTASSRAPSTAHVTVVTKRSRRQAL
jgi:hypothetical protein